MGRSAVGVPYTGSRLPPKGAGLQDVYRGAHRTVLAASNKPLLMWAWAVYIESTNLKGVSSMSQPTVCFMLQRIREAFRMDTHE